MISALRVTTMAMACPSHMATDGTCRGPRARNPEAGCAGARRDAATDDLDDLVPLVPSPSGIERDSHVRVRLQPARSPFHGHPSAVQRADSLLSGLEFTRPRVARTPADPAHRSGPVFRAGRAARTSSAIRPQA